MEKKKKMIIILYFINKKFLIQYYFVFNVYNIDKKSLLLFRKNQLSFGKFIVILFLINIILSFKNCIKFNKKEKYLKI